jgi:hypothetical protein
MLVLPGYGLTQDEAEKEESEEHYGKAIVPKEAAHNSPLKKY